MSRSLLVVASMALLGPVLFHVGFATSRSTSPIDADVDDEPKPPARIAWLPRLSDGFAAAQRTGRPILVRVERASCVWCQKLDVELSRPELVKELARWTTVTLDADAENSEAKGLDATATPALRILTPSGQFIAGREGFVPSAELLSWLQQNYDNSAVSIPAELTQTDPATAETVTKWIAALGVRDPTIREMATRRLLAQPKLAVSPIAEVLARGTLQTRLAAVEIIAEWGGPVEGLDPWRPETFTAERLKAVTVWAALAEPKPPGADTALTPMAREMLADDLARLATVTGSEATAVRERLVRFGSAARAAIAVELPKASTDTARERLTALRYRLAATDSLVLRWPSGLDRLADTRPAIRHLAAAELVRLATVVDEPLLLELFADADPLVRELSLKTLHQVSGKSATGAIAKLLNDPDPNVRAAVLKQFAEAPSPKIVTKIGEFLKTEKDIDLIVQAIKVLKESKGDAPIEFLSPLFRHENWRVRAEAVESAGAILSADRDSITGEVKATGYSDIRKALSDADGFVVGRAVGVLKKACKPDDITHLVKAASTHPELATTVVQTLNAHSELRGQALPHLRAFCKHANPDVRAEAIAAVCSKIEGELPAELLPALADSQSSVRQAAAESLFHSLDETLPDARSFSAPMPVGQQNPVAIRDRLRKLLAPAIPSLEKMLGTENATERVSAARTLVAFGREKQAMPAILAAVQTDPRHVGEASGVLPWLSAATCGEVMRQFLAMKPDSDGIENLIRAVSRVNDPKSSDLLWEISARGDVPFVAASRVAQALRQQFYGVFTNDEKPNAAQVKLIETAEAKAATGSPVQRLTALIVLAEAEPTKVRKPAAALAALANAGDLRRDALQLILLTSPQAEAEKIAIGHLTESDAIVRRNAMVFLCLGQSEIRHLTSAATWINVPSPSIRLPGRAQSQSPYVPRVPKGLAPATLRTLLRDSDPIVSAGAGYLLALLGDPSGLPTLTRYWRESQLNESEWGNLVAMAVASLDDDANVPILEEIYRVALAQGESHQANNWVKSLYWISRPLDGPNALRLRKAMRAEVGMTVIGSPND